MDSTIGALYTLEEQSLVAAPHIELGAAAVPDWGLLPADALESCEVRAGWRQQEMQTHLGRGQWLDSTSEFSQTTALKVNFDSGSFWSVIPVGKPSSRGMFLG